MAYAVASTWCSFSKFHLGEGLQPIILYASKKFCAAGFYPADICSPKTPSTFHKECRSIPYGILLERYVYIILCSLLEDVEHKKKG